ncbi:MAG: Do family serine endopeptidase [Campylobacterales bacterium]|nr:Do family serine endopeptidase [Campylobacterales bacterium]
MKLPFISRRTTFAIFAVIGISISTMAYFANNAQAQQVQFEQAAPSPQRTIPSSNQILSFNDILKDSMNAVVNINTKIKVRSNELQSLFNDPYFRQFMDPRYRQSQPKEHVPKGAGSGVILTHDGIIVTNYHVIADASEITVTLPNNKKEYKAKLIGIDKGTDLAVIKIDATNLKPIKMGRIEDVKVGDMVFAIGNPFGVGETVTQGIVSALNKHNMGINQYENFIQTDASINPGNSGGALVDSRGALIGINSAIFSKGGGNDGIGFTIPVDMVQNIVTQIVKHGKVNRGYMGITLSSLDEKLNTLYNHEYGAIVADVEPNSAALKAGVKRGDLIIAVNGIKIESPSVLQRFIGDKQPFEKITLTIERDKRTQNISLVLDDRAKALAALSQTIHGLTLSMITPQIRQKLGLRNVNGAIITDIDPNSKAAQEGFQVGDVIIQIENQPISSLDDARKAFSLRGKKRVYLNRYGIIGILIIS